MPLRQSTFHFGLRAAPNIPKRSEDSVEPSMDLRRGSPADTDTIIVDTTDINTQLPTPVDSATDASSQSSQGRMSRPMTKSRSKRVPSTSEKNAALREHLAAADSAEQDKNRSISGETLVPQGSTTLRSQQTTKDREDIDSLDGMYFLFDEDRADLLEEEQDDQENSSVITVQEDSEDEKLREEQRAAKITKMEENAKKWEQRKKAAEQSATRRSGRSSLMSKAGGMLDNIKETILGKRARSANEKEESQQSVSKPLQRFDSAGPVPKKKRTEEDAVSEEPKPRTAIVRREKKWLVSGLYAGQPRLFDARLTENKNRRKSKAVEEAQIKENTVVPLPMFAGERLLQNGRDFKLPFDVFSPLPAGQPKPDEWKKVNKNVFVGDAAEQWRTNKYVEHSSCICDPLVGCGQDCMNRYMYYECDERNCCRELNCGNRAFEQLKIRKEIGGKYNVGVEVMRTEDRGYGVRSNRTFLPNQIIVEYTGEIITQDECEQRMRTIYKNNECYYLMLFDQNMIIDATRGSIARFVNHSCEPNCRMEKWTVQGKPRMALFAGDHGIMTGEELTYDYNFDPYSQKNVQACRCGAENCRGVLGPKPKPEIKRPSPENEIARKKDGRPSGSKRKVVEVPEENTSRVNKKKKAVPPMKGKVRSPVKTKSGNKSPKRAVLVKKVASRKVSISKTTTKLARSDSKLKKLITGAKLKVGSVKGQRVPSTSSCTEALLGSKAVSVARSASLKEKAKNITRTVRARAKTIVVAA